VTNDHFGGGGGRGRSTEQDGCRAPSRIVYFSVNRRSLFTLANPEYLVHIWHCAFQLNTRLRFLFRLRQFQSFFPGKNKGTSVLMGTQSLPSMLGQR